MKNFFKETELKNRFEKALNTLDNPDFDAIDAIMQEDVWQNRRGLCKRQIRELELKALNILISRVNDIMENENRIDLEGISEIINRYVWKQVYSDRKRDIINRLEQYLQESVDELTKLGKFSSAYRRIEIFKQYYNENERAFQNKLEAQIKNCRKQKDEFNDYVNHEINKIKTLIHDGNFSRADSIIKHLFELTKDEKNLEISRLQNSFKNKRQDFHNDIKRIKQFIKNGMIDAAVERVKTFQNKYPKIEISNDIDRIIKHKIKKDLIQKTIELENDDNAESACKWLEARINHYKKWISFKEIIGEHKILLLYKRYLKILENEAVELVMQMHFQAAIHIIQQINDYNNQSNLLLKSFLFPLINSINEYTKFAAQKHIRQCKIKLKEIENNLKNNFNLNIDCEFVHNLKHLENLTNKWDSLLLLKPDNLADVNNLIEELNEVQSNDSEDYGKKAKARILELKNDLLIFEVNELWDQMAKKHKLTSNGLFNNLHLVTDNEFENFFDNIKEIYNKNKDCNEIYTYIKALENESAVRGMINRILKREADYFNTISKPEARDYFVICQELEKALNRYPDYKPVKDELFKRQDKIKTVLLEKFSNFISEKKYYSAMAVNKDWILYLNDQNMEKVIIQSFGQENRFELINNFIKKASEESTIAENFVIKNKYDNAREYIDKALMICADDPKARELKKQLNNFNEGIKWLKQVDQFIYAFDQKEISQLDKAQSILKKIKGLSINFKNLEQYGLKFSSDDIYQLEIQNRIGLIGKFRLCIIPGQNYLLLQYDNITIGSPKDKKAHIKIQAPGIIKKHASFNRKKHDFYIESENGKCFVNNQKISSQKLIKGDLIRLGMNFEFQVYSIYDGTMVLNMEYSDPIDYSLSGIIFMQNSLDLDANHKGHIFVPGLNEPCQIKYDNNEYYISNTKFKIDEIHDISNVKFQLLREMSYA